MKFFHAFLLNSTASHNLISIRRLFAERYAARNQKGDVAGKLMSCVMEYPAQESGRERGIWDRIEWDSGCQIFKYIEGASVLRT